MISVDSISITEPSFTHLSGHKIPLWDDAFVSTSVVVAFAVLVIGVYLALHMIWTYGFAIGGNERSAILMGLPVTSTKSGVYVLSGFCSALGGVLITLYMLSGYRAALGFELDTGRRQVIGGTLLTVGYVCWY